MPGEDWVEPIVVQRCREKGRQELINSPEHLTKYVGINTLTTKRAGTSPTRTIALDIQKREEEARR